MNLDMQNTRKHALLKKIIFIRTERGFTEKMKEWERIKGRGETQKQREREREKEVETERVKRFFSIKLTHAMTRELNLFIFLIDISC